MKTVQERLAAAKEKKQAKKDLAEKFKKRGKKGRKRQ